MTSVGLVGEAERERERETGMREKQKDKRDADGSIGNQSIDGASKKIQLFYFYLDSLDGVLDLEQPPFGTESVDAPVILGAGEEHCSGVEREGEKRKKMKESRGREGELFFPSSKLPRNAE